MSRRPSGYIGRTAPLRPRLGFEARPPRGFTLIEMVIVIGILVVLATLVMVGGSALVNRQRRGTTEGVMRVLEQAIEAYTQEGGFGDVNFKEQLYGESGPPARTSSPSHAGRYGPFPPDAFTYDGQNSSLTARIERHDDHGELIADFNGNGLCDAAYLNADLAGFLDLEERIGGVNGNWSPKQQLSPNTPPPATLKDYHSIEAFYLYATNFSPGARDVLKGLPGENITNQDTNSGESRPDRVAIDTNPFDNKDEADQWIDLFEVTDAWGNPLSYMVRGRSLQSKENEDFGVGIGGHHWEMRSAGPDERFEGHWASDNRDDIALSRP